jgi:hypothetical protein
VRIVQPSSYGLPSVAEADARLEERDMAAMLSFNLLGVQPLVGPVDWRWVGEVLERFARTHPAAPELPLLRVRQATVAQRQAPAVAAAAYERIAASVDSTARFTFTGVEDARRLDSYFDPFGNLGVQERALVEGAREWVRAGKPERAERLRTRLVSTGTWSGLRRAQLAVYWQRYVQEARTNAREQPR